MSKAILMFLLIIFISFASTFSQAQGIMDILERLDTIEQRMSEVDAAVADAAAGGSAAEAPDMSLYDESLLEMGTQIRELKQLVADLPTAAPATGTDPGVTSQLDSLEKQISGLKEALLAVQQQQSAWFADLQAKLLPEEPHPVVVEAEQCAEAATCPGAAACAEAVCTDLSISGFVDASFFYDGQTGDNTFGWDQTEIDIEKSLGAKGSIRVDLEWCNDGAGGTTMDAEQSYVTYSPAGGTFTFGKFNAPIGFELLDAPDMYQYSHALVFNNGLPTNLSGLMFSTPMGTGMDLSVYTCNGWDQNVDVNTGKTFGGRFGYGNDTWGGIGFSLIHGAETPDEGDKLTVFDFDGTFTPSPTWTLGTELNIGSDSVGGETLGWMGFLVMSHWDFNDFWGTTVRFDYFDDKDALRLSGVAEKRTAIAIAPTFCLGDGMGALMELRLESSDQEVFVDQDGAAAKSALCFAAEMTYSF